MAKAKETTISKEEQEIIKLQAKMKPAHLRFLSLYMGGEDGSCWNNATKSYLKAFEIDTVTTKIKDPKTGELGYTKEYKSARASAIALLTSINIQKLKNYILLNVGYDKDVIKKRYTEIAMQNKNLPVALQANDRVAKIAGVLNVDDKKVDIPQLTELGDAMKQLLTPKR